MADVTTTVQEQMKKRDTANQETINKAYDSGLASQKQGLLDAYNQNTAAQTQQQQNVQKNYAAATQDVGVQNARNNRNLTQFADVRRVNTQAGSQHQLSLANSGAKALGGLAFQQQQAMQEVDRQKQLMTTTYQNQVQAAIADNDYKRAAALLDSYNNNQKWQDQQAAILASYGNFEGYRPLYGDAAANGMQSVWNAQNPEVAYRSGRISAETYKQITGEYPRGYTPPWSGGGFSGWGYVPTGNPDPEDNGPEYTYTDPGSDGYGNNKQIYVPPKASPNTTKNAGGFSGGGGRVRR